MRIELISRSRRRSSLTPLIDVVFLLLVFYMLVSRLVSLQTINLNAPATESPGGSMEGTVLIRLLENGHLNLNGVPLTLNQLQNRVRDYLARDPQQPFLIRPAPSVPLQPLVDVLDRLNKAGASHITLMKQ
jgi:biopolymer transport protein ExbD